MSKLDEARKSYVDLNLSWDICEGNKWDEVAKDTFKAGALWLLEEARKMVKEHENKFHPKPARWLLSGLEQLCEGEVKK